MHDMFNTLVFGRNREWSSTGQLEDLARPSLTLCDGEFDVAQRAAAMQAIVLLLSNRQFSSEFSREWCFGVSRKNWSP